MATSWVTLSEADVLLAMPTDIRTLYDAWIAANPDKSDSLGRIRSDTIAAIRTAIYTNKENTLDPDIEKIPQDLRPTALDLITVRLAMEAGIQLSGAATQVRNDADQLLRQISYGRWRVETPGYEPSPRYTPATRTRKALPALIAVMLAVLTNAEAAFTTTGSGSTINVGNVAVTNNILISNTVNVVGTTITNSFAPINNVSNSIANSFSPINNVTNTIANTVTNSFAPVNNVTNAVTTVVTNSFAPQNYITNTFTLDAGISITNNFGDTIINATSQVNVAGVVITNIVQINNPGIAALNSATTGGVFIVVSNGWDAGITSNGNIFTITTGLPQGATGVNQVATWNGTNWIATALGAPTPTPAVGTNKILWTTVWGVTNTWVAPSTQIMFTVWGAGGGGGGGGAGFGKALWVGSAGTVFDIVIGTGGGYAATNNGPFAGSGILQANTNYCNGGGATYIAISGTTNIILMAGGSGGGSSSASSGFGGPGGGYWFTSLDGTTSGTNVQAGQGGWASNEYGLAATAGTNLSASITNLMQNGGYLRGGHGSTNGCTSGTFGALGGGGGGWYGGAGGTRTNATAGMSANTGAGGGGGLGYANTNYVTFAQLIAGQRAVNGVPNGQDHPTYTASRGIGSTANGSGQNGCAGAMW